MRGQNLHYRALFCTHHPTDVWLINIIPAVKGSTYKVPLFNRLRAEGVQSSKRRNDVSVGFSFQPSRCHRWVLFVSFTWPLPLIGYYVWLLLDFDWNPIMTFAYGKLGDQTIFIIFVWSSSHRVWCRFRVNYQFKCQTEHVQQRGSFRGALGQLGSKCATPNKLKRAGFGKATRTAAGCACTANKLQEGLGEGRGPVEKRERV